MTKPNSNPDIPEVPRASRDPMTKREQIYVAVLAHWFRFRDRAPTMPELAKVCRPRRSLTAIRNALLQAEIKGWVRRNSQGRFEVVP